MMSLHTVLKQLLQVVRITCQLQNKRSSSDFLWNVLVQQLHVVFDAVDIGLLVQLQYHNRACVMPLNSPSYHTNQLVFTPASDKATNSLSVMSNLAKKFKNTLIQHSVLIESVGGKKSWYS